MAKYKYIAQDAKGKRTGGISEASSSEELYRNLQQRNLMLVSCRAVVKAKRIKKFNPSALSDFCRQLGTMQNSGISLIRALIIITRSEGLGKWQKAIYEGLVSSVKKGNALSTAMEETEGAFPEMLINMYKTAEVSGNMGAVSVKMSEYYSRQYKLNKKISSAFLYPAILLFLVAAVVIFLVSYIIPELSGLLSSIERLPLPTRILLWLSSAIQNHWLLIIAAIGAAAVIFVFLFKNNAFRCVFDRIILHIPYFGRILKEVYSAGFARTIASLYASGLPIASSLIIGSRTLGNKYIEKQFEGLIAQVRSGRSLSSALREVDGFVSKLADTTFVGEETGRLGEMLSSTADALEFEAEAAINKMLTLLEPVLIITMGLIVGFVMVSIMLPVYQSYSSVGVQGGL